MRGGSYLVARRIRMLIEVWDRASLGEQERDDRPREEHRARRSAAGASTTRSTCRPAAPTGPVIPVDAHIRLAAPSTNADQQILRRGYSFTDGFDSELGQLDAGLFFIGFQRDPHEQFVAIQRRLGTGDHLNEYIKHVGSAVFAVPPGVRPGGSIADGLFSA